MEKYNRRGIKMEKLQIVASCCKCGSPIYGKKTINKDEVPSVKYSCVCRTIQEIIPHIGCQHCFCINKWCSSSGWGGTCCKCGIYIGPIYPSYSYPFVGNYPVITSNSSNNLGLENVQSRN